MAARSSGTTSNGRPVRTALAVFSRDLRLRDNPALAAACDRADQVVPVFVLDKALTALSPNRTRFLLDSLAGLRRGLRDRGADLVIRQGDPVAEIMRLAAATSAEEIFIADDVSHYAARRRAGLEREAARHRLGLTVTPGLTIVPPGALTPAGGGHYRVFTPYWRAWSAARWRRAVSVPGRIRLPGGVRTGRIPGRAAACSPGLLAGGEEAGHQRAEAFLRGQLGGYAGHHDDLPGDETSRLSAYLRFGCISPLVLAEAAKHRADGAEFCRQLAWRDFYHQVTAAFPDMAHKDYRPRGGSWREDPAGLAAWREGRTGIPIVDAGMRQLAAEGFMHNRARLIAGSFLTKHLRIDWRHGYRHFFELLTDGDVANNAGNWQWVAGTGNDTRPNRVLNPLRQARRFDPDGEYVRRYVPELRNVAGPGVHTPWQLPASRRRGYPGPIIAPAGA